MLVVHHLNESRSQRLLWLLEELGLSYQIKRYQRDPETMLAPASLRAVHPLGKSPVLSDGELVLAESGAIMKYLVERYGNGRLIPPLGSNEHLRYRYWLHYAEGSAMPPLLLKLVFDRLERGPAPFFLKPLLRAISGKVKGAFIEPQLTLHLDYMESELAKIHLVCRQRAHRRRHPDELPARSRPSACRARLGSAALDRVFGAHPCAARVSACARAGRGVRAG